MLFLTFTGYNFRLFFKGAVILRMDLNVLPKTIVAKKSFNAALYGDKQLYKWQENRFLPVETKESCNGESKMGRGIMSRGGVHIVADVGGTNTRLALSAGTALRKETLKRYENATASCLEDILDRYISEMNVSLFDGICIAVAGPAHQDRAELTNIDWTIQKSALQKIAKTEKAGIINDMQAQGYALSALNDTDIKHVYGTPHVDKTKRMLVCGVGTGFNIALSIPTPHGVIVPPAEAGHTRLPVRNATEQKVVDYLTKKNGFAEVEEVISGRGMALVNHVLYPNSPRTSQDVIQSAPENAEARHVVDVFCGFAGSYFGDLALTTLPEGGIFLIGGLARALEPFMSETNFGAAFCDKGRFSEMNKSFGVNLVVDDFAALRGCANYLTQG